MHTAKMFAKIGAILRSPGARRDIATAAPTQHVKSVAMDDEKSGTTIVVTPNGSNDDRGYTVAAKARRLDRWLDAIVRFSGSELVFGLLCAGLLTWAFLGIRLHADLNWQVLISDIQAILGYFFDSLLMRQQLNAYGRALSASAQLRSRALSHRRMLTTLLHSCDKTQGYAPAVTTDPDVLSDLHDPYSPSDAEEGYAANLPKENWFGRFATGLSRVVGHILTIAVFWVSMAIWLAFGPTNGWSNKWQLYINSATSALMIFVFAFLANIRERHAAYSYACLDATFRVDSALERALRARTHDHLANDVVVVRAPHVNALQRAIYYYADLVGTLVGVALLILAIVVWIAIGPLLHFNSNWWLLIGTYAGLVGLNDGFVLRNVQAKLQDHEIQEFDAVAREDVALFALIQTEAPAKREDARRVSLSSRISLAVGRFCAHELTVLVGVMVIIGLVTGSSVMRWSTTGQLLSNIPSSIIESFFMIILITGHNFADAERRVEIQQLYERRMALLAWVRRFGPIPLPPSPPSSD